MNGKSRRKTVFVAALLTGTTLTTLWAQTAAPAGYESAVSAMAPLQREAQALFSQEPPQRRKQSESAIQREAGQKIGAMVAAGKYPPYLYEEQEARTRAFMRSSGLGAIKGWKGRAVLVQEGGWNFAGGAQVNNRVLIADFTTTRKYFSGEKQIWSGPYTLRAAEATYSVQGQNRPQTWFFAPQTVERTNPAALQIWASDSGYQIRFQGLSLNRMQLRQPNVNGYMAPQIDLLKLSDGGFFPYEKSGQSVVKRLRGDIVFPVDAPARAKDLRGEMTVRIAWNVAPL